jgi:RNA polymerase sigma-70 factor, ECF subfamily
MTASPAMAADAEAQQGLGEVEFREFYDLTARPLRAWLRRVAGAERVDDISQEAYLRLLRTPARDLPVNERRAYLYRVASNLVNDEWRATKRSGGPTVAVDAVVLEAPAGEAGEALDLSRAMTKLRLKERTMLWLAYVERATHREIAAALDVKEASVRVLLSRARQKLASALGTGRGGRS